jgi:hypothetical protein
MSRSADRVSWTAVTRVPIDPATSSVDHFLPGLGVDQRTYGPSTRLGLYYYYLPNADCSIATCQLDVGFISSSNAGATWSTPTHVAGPMSLSQFAKTSLGVMVGDYISATFVGDRASSVFAVGRPPSGKEFDEAMYTVPDGLAAPGGSQT